MVNGALFSGKLKLNQVAIVGVACRFPGARNYQQFWDNLANDRLSVSDIPMFRWEWETYWGDPKREVNKSDSKWGGFIEDVDKFDTSFFGISPKEAISMDPQQRIMLEMAWGCFENAGIVPSTLSGKKVGVFTGVFNFDYKELQEKGALDIEAHHSTGTAAAVIPNRISYYFNLKGPSYPIDTACSSSLNAIHSAIQSIESGECEMALAGGISLILTPTRHISFAKTGMLSPSGQCKTFDADADGYVRGEGAGLVLLKPYERAKEDGDFIWAKVCGSAVNHGGKGFTLTYPSVEAQADVIQTAIEKSGVDKETISYVETHGTGTPKGDPIEIEGLKKAFAGDGRLNECALSSVKTNIGHLESAAGIAGVIKVLLSLRNKAIPPLHGFEKLNPKIQIKESPFYMVDQLTDWPETRDTLGNVIPRRAGVSSFGFGGTNAHLIIEEEIEINHHVEDDSGPYLFCFSAKTKEALKNALFSFAEWMEVESDKFDLRDISHTLKFGRENLNWRSAFEAGTRDEFAHHINRIIEKEMYCKVGAGQSDVPQDLPDRVKPFLTKESVKHEHCHGKIVPIPGYCFEKESYWVSNVESAAGGDTLDLKCSWESINEYEHKKQEEYTNLFVIHIDPYIKETLRKNYPGATFTFFEIDEDASLAEQFKSFSLLCFQGVKNAFQLKRNEKSHFKILIPNNSQLEVFKGVASLFRSASIENPKLDFQCIYYDAIEKSIPRSLWGVSELLLKEGKYYRKKWEEYTLNDTNPIINNDLVILITGGLGGLGKILIDSFYNKNKSCTLVIVGRSNKEELEKLNARYSSPRFTLEYYQLDVCQINQVNEVIHKIIATHSKLDGIIHAAGSIKDSYIINKSSDDFESVLNVKVQGLENLDLATKDLPLAFFIAFSSMVGVWGNIGQSDYAAANSFLDHYILFRNELVEQGLRHGKSLSFQWPLWRHGGMQIDTSSEKLMDKVWGIQPIESSLGVDFFFKNLDQSVGNCFLVQGDKTKILDVLNPRFDASNLTDDIQQVKSEFFEILENILQVSSGALSEYTEINELGLGQYELTELSNLLGQKYDVLIDASEIWEFENVGELFKRVNEIKSPSTTKGSTQKVDEALSGDAVLERLIILLGEVTGYDKNKISSDEPFENYGVDSIAITSLNLELEDVFIDISKTLFYEYQDLNGVAAYLVENYPQQCVNWCGLVDYNKTDSVEEHAESSLHEHVFETHSNRDEKEIAIVGLSGRYANAANVNEFWQNLKQGKDSITEIPEERWGIEEFYFPDKQEAISQGKSYSKWGSFLEDFASFDNEFFKLSPRESMEMDPQERIFLEVCWEALEDAGYTREYLRHQCDNNVGVFGGITKTGYELYGEQLRAQGNLEYPKTWFSSLTNRLSYFMDFNGPSIPVDTMCSSSLVAIHEACENLKRGDCTVAIAGGVNLYLHPSSYTWLSSMQMLSSQGKCKSFGRGSDGFVPGEGAGVVVLRKLSDAIKNRDNIYAIIKGTGVNHGGKVNGYTVPNPVAQGNLIRDTIAKARIDARHISYIEAHGTGTSLGDPIEITGLNRGFGDVQDKNYCSIGSAKSNIGHLESAAGIAGLTKVLLQMKHKQLVPSLHVEELNPNINFSKSPFKVQKELESWSPEVNGVSLPRIAGISSFGAGGVNAHIVVEDYGGDDINLNGNSKFLFVFSASDSESLMALIGRYTKHFETEHISSSYLNKAAYTLQMGREHFRERLAFIVQNPDELLGKLKSVNSGEFNSCYRGCAGEYSKLSDTDFKLYQEQNQFDKILNMWTKGSEIPWSLLYQFGDTPVKVSLPTYVFKKNRYWIKDKLKAIAKPSLHENNSLNSPAKTHRSVKKIESELIIKTKDWTDHEVNDLETNEGLRIVFYTDTFSREVSLLESEDHRYVELEKGSVSVVKQLNQALATMIEELKNDSLDLIGSSILIQVIVSENDSVYSSLIGALRTIHLEYPNVKVQFLSVQGQLLHKSLEEWSDELATCPSDEVRFAESQYETLSWKELLVSNKAVKVWKDNGVYIILGGSGGLGQIMVHDIIKTTKSCSIIITGRKAKKLKKDAGKNGNRILYRQIDINDYESVKSLLDEIYASYQRVDGIIHAAGVLADSFIHNKNVNEITSVLSPKVNGCLNIDRAIANRPLGFLALFSSTASALGSVGQIDYSTANAYLDHFAYLRNEGVQKGSKHGKTLSINWGLWENGGMQVDDETLVTMSENLGIVPIETQNGVRAFHHAVHSGETQLLVVEGNKEQFHEFLEGSEKSDLVNENIYDVSVDIKGLVLDKLKKLYSSLTDYPVTSIDPDVDLESYSIDSIIITRMNFDLEKALGKIPKTLFFKYQTLNQIAGYLSEKHYKECLNWCHVQAENANQQVADSTQRDEEKPEMKSFESRDIAIIGLSGSYPGCASLGDFWEMLQNGKSGIGTIPEDRWVLDNFFDEQKSQAYEQGLSYSKWGGFLKSFDEFDPVFFGLSVKDALIMDPQERIFLQSCWHLMEDAGYTRNSIKEKYQKNVGVFVGITKSGYELYENELAGNEEYLNLRTSFGSVANRVSYHLDFEGPSMPIDTMCSSSLVAIHEACNHIYNGDCRIAIAGGVNLYLHPSNYTELCQYHMLSESSECKSFGLGDGFVPGEGVGAVLLKPLEQAIGDKDNIYGVVKGSAINHGGKVNGYNVPNPNAQRDVIHNALKKSGVDARSVSYIEAHGTGTKLGDPIEVEGLTEAFEEYTSDKQFCSIASTKSSIGHLESAAGIAGLTRVLLQLRYKQLAPSLNVEELNPNIEFEETPFYVQRDLSFWKQPVIAGVVQPRRAGISSFGAGGANAHLIVEEFEQKKDQYEHNDSCIFILSSKTSDGLKGLAEKYLRYLESTTENIFNICRTLQLGREHFSYRLGFVCHSIDDILEKLHSFLDEESLVPAPSNSNQNIDYLIKEKDYKSLVFQWLNGSDISWEKVHVEVEWKRVSLPGYVFAKKKLWLTQLKSSIKKRKMDTPLIKESFVKKIGDNENTILFQASFSKNDFFLRDHVIHGESILPGVMYLELIRECMNQIQEHSAFSINNVVWLKPIKLVQDKIQPQIELSLLDAKHKFVIFTWEKNSKVIHAQGNVGYAEEIKKYCAADLVAQRCNMEFISQEDFYQKFHRIGMDCGPGHRGVLKSMVGQQEVIAKLKINPEINDTLDDYVLHPCLMDSATQASISLIHEIQNDSPFLPYALEKLIVHEKCRKNMWAWVRHVSNSKDGKGCYVDIDLIDDQGTVCVQFIHLFLRILSESSVQEMNVDTLLMEPKKISIPYAVNANQAHHRVVFIHPKLSLLQEVLVSSGGNAQSHFIKINDHLSDVDNFISVSKELMQELKNLINQRKESLVQILMPENEESIWLGLTGIVKTLNIESTKLKVQLIFCNSYDTNTILNPLDSSPVLWLKENTVETIKYVKYEAPFHGGEVCWKEGATYLITGGLGGLAKIFLEEIVKNVSKVDVYLTGRSEVKDSDLKNLEGWSSRSINIHYISCDVSNPLSTQNLFDEIRANTRFSLKGIIHSAGVIRDSFLAQKNLDDVEKVLSPKIKGVQLLDEYSRHDKLDFFVTFSSMAAVIGNAGQADYAAANAYMDAFIKQRAKHVFNNIRSGKSISINWPLWRCGGMQVDGNSEKIIFQSTGMLPMKTESGVKAFYQALQSDASQILVAEGDVDIIKNKMLDYWQEEKVYTQTPELKNKHNESDLMHGIKNKIVTIVAEILGLEINEVQMNIGFHDMGFDSISLTTLANTLNVEFNLDFTPALFFDVLSIEELLQYFQKNDLVSQELLNAEENIEADSVHEIEFAAPKIINRETLKSEPYISKKEGFKTVDNSKEKIAIIGMSGKFPEANSIEEFWQNLIDSKDCISEIPESRWKWQDFYGDPYLEDHKTNIKWGGFIDGVDEFDSLFFDISPREAELMDPQQRLMMEYIWNVIEDAGYSASSLSGKNIGIFIGTMASNYQSLIYDSGTAPEGFSATGIVPSVGPNRMSYLLNFNGPSEPVETACSSSLVAIHKAIEEIRTRRCEAAIVGGVNTIPTPELHIGLNRAGMLSIDGRCKTFSKDANGYVRSEAVGMLMLKPLPKAIEDRDNVYATILSSAVNHGGKASSLTAPNTKAQASLIVDAVEKADIDPRSISYIEAHGTGTELGDPVEVEALKSAFQSLTHKGLELQGNPSCGLGTVKSNIGHTELAAGVSGVIKTVLQLKNKYLVQSLHSDEISPYVKLQNSPFYILQSAKKWEVNNLFPRRAGVSSFGFGGVNAHVILEEYDIPGKNIRHSKHLVVLSAKTHKALKQRVESIIQWCQNHEDDELGNLSYTLQVGRDHMDYRLAVVVFSLSQLERELQNYLTNPQLSNEMRYGNAQENNRSKDIFSDDEDLAQVVASWVSKEKFIKVAELWVQGLDFDWNIINQGKGYQRISLPGYPFAKVKHWVKGDNSLSTKVISDRVHPLLHRNVSTIYEQKFKSSFDGKEFFFNDHVVQGNKVLPGVAYLEMALAAFEHSTERKNTSGIAIKNLMWSSPILGNEALDVYTLINPNEKDVSYSIYTLRDDEKIIHSEGYLEEIQVESSKQQFSWQTKRSELVQHIEHVEIYQHFDKIGIKYGNAHKGLNKIYTNGSELLAQISLPRSMVANADSYVLHPSILDAMFQATVFVNDSLKDTTYLPFVLDRLNVYNNSTDSEMWAHVVLEDSHSNIQKYDLHLYDNENKCYLEFLGLTAREIKAESSTSEISSDTKPKHIDQLLSQELRNTLGVELEDVDPETPLVEYGLELVQFQLLISSLNNQFKAINGEPNFETCNIQQLSDAYEFKIVKQEDEIPQVIEESNLSFKDDVNAFLIGQLSEVIRLPSGEINEFTPFEKYGIDSVMVMQFTSKLERTFGPLSKTLLFEYSNISSLANYFLESYRNVLSSILNKKNIEKTDERLVEIKTPVREKEYQRFHAKNNEAVLEAPRKNQGKVDVAIVGMSGTFPKSNNIEEYWKNLLHGVDCITEIPKNRWNHDYFYDDKKGIAGRTYSKWGGFLDSVSAFDPLFFNISPKEAIKMDPQERLFLTCAYEAIEDSGYTSNTLLKSSEENSVGVYVGVMYLEYQLYGIQETLRGRPAAMYGNSSSVANRVSSFFNFNGPSMAMDTMCSSSLTSIHLACQGIQNGDCEMAIAGGVNVSVHPNKYILLSQGNFVSSNGRCESFGTGGDGYVPSEGVGALILKPLDNATRDNDQIYGVIKATSINHGGKTNGYTVPNPAQQANTIVKALEKGGVDPRKISYIEAHGTGTSLGDPIEIAGLTKAFKKYSSDNQFCRIGSAKSNIGHCEGAAGVAGVIKVLLQMKHKKLVPSLHSKVLNANIDFASTPFLVQQELEAWNKPVINGVEAPRMAGVSAFGAGGSNAHVIIEEFDRVEEKKNISIIPLLVLSATTPEDLKTKAEDMVQKISVLSESDLDSVLYTMQVGREAFEERIAFEVSSLLQITTELNYFIRDDESFSGSINSVGENDANKYLPEMKGPVKGTIQKALNTRDYFTIMNLWVNGEFIDWNTLYEKGNPRKISLPTYPFAKEEYWLPKEQALNEDQIGFSDIESPSSASKAFMDVVLIKEENNLKQFKVDFDGTEFFLKHHLVQGQKVLPGVVYIDLVYRSIDYIINGDCCSIQNLMWVQPFIYERQSRLYLEILLEKEISFTVYSIENDSNRVIHSTGTLAMNGDTLVPNYSKALPELLNTVDVNALYDAFSKKGIEYGDSHRAIRKATLKGNAVFGELVLPDSIKESFSEFIIHPSLLDSALQLCILYDGFDGSGDTYLPFSIEKMHFLKPLQQEMSVIVEKESLGKNSPIQKYKVLLINANKELCIEIVGLTARKYNEQKIKNAYLFDERWIEIDDDNFSDNITYVDKSIILLDELGQTNNQDIIPLKSSHSSINDIVKDYAVQLLNILKNKMGAKVDQRSYVAVFVPMEKGFQVMESLSGMLKTASLENPNIKTQLIGIENSEVPNLEKVVQRFESVPAFELRYQSGKGYVKKRALTHVKTDQHPYKNNSTYLITGGMGGLGLLFAQDIISKVTNCNIILTGRSDLNDQKQKVLSELQKGGNKTYYQKLDVCSAIDVKNAIQHISQGYGLINGVIHSAGVIEDTYILRKDVESFNRVISPKVDGAFHLDNAIGNLPLDFFILFSSASGCLGNAGQVDYALGNSFLDRFAEYRKELVTSGSRKGRSISINWPLWKNGGMRIDDKMEELLKESTGMVAMNDETGLKAFYLALNSGLSNMMVLDGDLEKMKSKLLNHHYYEGEYGNHSKEDVSDPIETVNQGFDGEELKEKAQEFFRNLIADTTEVSASRIKLDSLFDKYGLDSVMTMDMTNKLEAIFGSLSKTLFFEYQTVNEVTDFFLKEHNDVLASHLGIQKEEQQVVKSSIDTEEFNPKVTDSFHDSQDDSEGINDNDIAIIGISGKYPDAENIEQFWDNLKQGKSSITEIPETRWNSEEFYNSEKGELNKTNCKWGSFINGVDEFDPLFFNISPADAKLIDPNERLFLETTWNLLEASGITSTILKEKYQNNVGVYVGAMYQHYQAIDSDLRSKSARMIFSYGFIANRVSWFFNLKGPSIALDSMCSSSLTGMHMACQAIRNGDISLAIAGGVNLSIHPNKYLGLSVPELLGSKSDSISFSDGDGYIPAEGVGAVLLKSLKKAKEDGDTILAVVKASGVNHSGKTHGFMVPNPKQQTELFQNVLRSADIDVHSIDYIEAAANGSALGDPIEFSALSNVFKDVPNIKMGSVKTNFGHGEAVSGMMQLTKTVLQLKNNVIVPSIIANRLNHELDFSNSPFELNNQLIHWDKDERVKKRALISSIGAGGTHSCLVLEEHENIQSYVSVAGNTLNSDENLFVFSAMSYESLSAILDHYQNYLRVHRDANLNQLAYSLCMHREILELRVAVIANGAEQLIQILKDISVKGNKINANSDNVFWSDRSSCSHELLGHEDDSDLNSVGKLWIHGENINWNSRFDISSKVLLNLPTYPFHKKRYWVDVKEDNPQKSLDKNDKEVDRFLLDFISKELEMKENELDRTVPLEQYGATSITMMKLIRALQKQFQVELSIKELFLHSTFLGILELLEEKLEDDPVHDQEPIKKDTSLDDSLEQFKKGDLSTSEIEQLINEGIL